MIVSRIVVTAFCGLCAIAAFGQDQQPVPGQTEPGQTDQKQTGARDNRRSNQPGRDSGTLNTGENASNPDVIPGLDEDPNTTPEQRASAEYSGPAVLSRSIAASAPLNPKNVKFTPQLGVEFLHNSGLTGVKLQNGRAPNQSADGLQFSYGVSGEKVYRRDTLSLVFTGNLYHYTQASGYDGTDNQLALVWRHRLARHVSFGIHSVFQEYNRNNLIQNGSGLITSTTGSQTTYSSPLTEVFDGRVITMDNTAELTYQLSARLSFNFSGGGFFTRRASSSLYGATGYHGGGDMAYRFTRRTTAGVYYSYQHFDFTGVYGATDAQTLGLTYSVAFTPVTELITRIGASKVETTGLTSVALDPFLTAILGTPSTIEAFYSNRYVPDLDLQLRHKLSNVTLTLQYSRGLTPGNGVILTSQRQSAIFGVNFKARRRWNISGVSGYDTLSSVGATAQKYASYYGSAGIYRQIYRHLDWHVRADFHHYTFDNTGFLRNSYSLSTGVVWSPGDILERLW